MDDLTSIVLLIASVLAPIAAFIRAARQPQPTAGKLITASTLAGLAVGVSFFALAVVGDLRTLQNSDFYVWIFVFALNGAWIGVAGVLARFLGRAWSSRV